MFRELVRADNGFLQKMFREIERLVSVLFCVLCIHSTEAGAKQHKRAAKSQGNRAREIRVKSEENREHRTENREHRADRQDKVTHTIRAFTLC